MRCLILFVFMGMFAANFFLGSNRGGRCDRRLVGIYGLEHR